MNVADSLGRWADETPFAAAIVDASRVIHYRDLDRAVWRAASWLRQHGVRAGDRVGVSLRDDSVELLVVVYALARIGAVLMLLPSFELQAVRLALARRFRLAAVVGDDEAVRLDPLPLLRRSRDWFEPGSAAVDRQLRVEGGAAPWRIALSSGTTGAPKAVVRSHREQVRLSEIGLNQVAGRGGRYLTLTTLQLVFGLSQPLLTLHGGGLVRIVRLPIALAELCEVIDREQITHLTITPTFARDLLLHLSDDKPRFPGLRNLALCTMAVPEAMRREIRRRITPNLVVYYATNEAWYLTVADVATQPGRPDTVGFPVDGIEIEIVDERDRRRAPGEVGLVRARGPTLPTSYLDDPEASAGAFRDGWYYPGDLGYLAPDGALFLSGRADDVINDDGVKIYPSDIEAALLQHPSVDEAAAFALTSDEFRQVPVAAVVLRAAASPSELVAFAGARLGRRAPRWVYVLTSLPKTASGKVVKRQLAQQLSETLAGGKKDH
jgi:acyl-CoA synthetase (AMP-forming)/AMP-acid ligase II